MARKELKVFSMSFLDLLCCGLGAVILLNLLMIVSIRKRAAGALDYTYVIADAQIWIRLDEAFSKNHFGNASKHCLLYTSPSPRDQRGSRMPSSA